MTSLQIVRPDVSQLSISEMAKQYPPQGWEKVFKEAQPELQLASHLLTQLEPYFPPQEKLFRALDLCSLDQVKVVIVGQDPYHSTDNGYPQANGMAFSTDRGHPVQPSLRNIYKELAQEYGEQSIYDVSNQYMANRNYLLQHYKPEYYQAEPERITLGNGSNIYLEVKAEPKAELQGMTSYEYETKINASLRKQTGMTHEQLVTFMNQTDAQIVDYVRKTIPVFKDPGHGDLSKWAQQGVLLLNSCLTVTPHQPGSHKQMWNGVIKRILDAITEVNPECIYLLWGANARKVGDKLGQRAIKLEASHPSPLGAYRKSRDVPAFMGCGHFRKANEYLKEQGKTPIDWILD